VEFKPGLNIITGPISSGKTTLLRLCQGMFGSSLNNFPPEARAHINALAAQILLGESRFSIVRPFTSTATAKVDIAGDNLTIRLPALQLDASASLTYGQWLLRTLKLPVVKVPSAPSRADSEPSPLSINDFFLYCVLSQDEIDKSVFGHHDYFTNIKRKYVFEVLYGIYTPEIFQQQERLHQISLQLSQLSSQSSAFERLLADTPWANRAALMNQLTKANQSLKDFESDASKTVEAGLTSSRARGLREEIIALEKRLGAVREAQAHEQETLQQLSRLVRQLEAQSRRLTRAIVAGEYLTDFEFVVCPRCGTPVRTDRGTDEVCMLCLQEPSPQASRASLIAEQDRLESQFTETKDLMTRHEEAERNLSRQLLQLETRRSEVGRELDFETRSYVSDTATSIADRAARRSSITESIRRYQDYLRLYEKLDEVLSEQARLGSEKAKIEAQLAAASSERSLVEKRIKHLEKTFSDILQRLEVPRFSTEFEASIDRRTYLPIVYGRTFDSLSSLGLTVLVNVAYALAQQKTSLELGLNLPNILLIDGLTSNVGHEGFDLRRIHKAFDYLIEVSEEIGSQLQIIVADGNIPNEAKPFVRLRLSETNRLIPM
jgi:tetratricopeptide (TPR) repeat protein